MSISYNLSLVYSFQNLTSAINEISNVKNTFLEKDSSNIECKYSNIVDEDIIEYSVYSNDTIFMRRSTMYNFIDMIENAVLFI